MNPSSVQKARQWGTGPMRRRRPGPGGYGSDMRCSRCDDVIAGRPPIITSSGCVCDACLNPTDEYRIYCVVCERLVRGRLGDLDTEIGTICAYHAPDYCICGRERAICQGRCPAVAEQRADQFLHSEI